MLVFVGPDRSDCVLTATVENSELKLLNPRAYDPYETDDQYEIETETETETVQKEDLYLSELSCL